MEQLAWISKKQRKGRRAVKRKGLEEEVKQMWKRRPIEQSMPGKQQLSSLCITNVEQ